MPADLDGNRMSRFLSHSVPTDSSAPLAEDVRDDGSVGRPEAIAAGVIHDLNNMLTIVLGSLEQLHRQALDERGRRQLARAQWGARQAGRLARQVLASANGAPTGAEIADLNETVAMFAETMDQRTEHGIGLVMEAAPGPLLARFDPEQLELALLNLVRNAADAMAGADPVVIRTAANRVTDRAGRATVEVAVSDTGTGMSPEVAQQSTNAFFSTKGPNQGTGLGLWRVQRFAAEAGGKVEIETAQGQGTTVRLILPRWVPE